MSVGRSMLKKRIIPIQLLLNDRLVKTVNFDEYRDVGDPVSSSRVYNSQYADELIFLNIDRGIKSITPLLQVLEKVSSVCFMPLALGGGIRSFDDAAQLIRNGADKVVLNSICYQEPQLIREIAQHFGSQAVVVAMDVRWSTALKTYQLFSNCGRQLESVSLKDYVKQCIDAGAGEIFIQSIDRDGAMQGFDIGLVKQILAISSVPVIACGGSGNYHHLKDLFTEAKVDAIACGSIFNFSDSNLIRAKAFLSNYHLSFKIV